MRIPSDQLPHITALAADYLRHDERIRPFFNGDFRDSAGYHLRLDEVRSRVLPLNTLLPILKEQNQHFGCGAATIDNLEKMAQHHAGAVVTGQQVGLFGGPLYTVYKALTAIKLAQQLNTERPNGYVPIFWLASDDHDFREIHLTHFINKENQVRTLRSEDYPLDVKIPASQLMISPRIADLIEQSRLETHPSEFKDNVLARLSNAYQPGFSYATAFARWLMQLFNSFGLIIIDASDERIKTLVKHIFYEEIAEKSPSTREALRSSNLLEERHYHAQVRLAPGSLNLFLIQNGRQPIHYERDVFFLKESQQTFSTTALLTLLDKQPGQFSPNVILRPIIQDALLPTVVYVAGTAEIAYFAQLKNVYRLFNLPMPLIYPRKGLTIVDRKINTILEKYQQQVPDFWANADTLIHQISRNQLPESIEDKLKSALTNIENHVHDLRDEILAIEPTLAETIDGVKGKIQHQFDVLEKKVVQAYKKRNDIIRQQIYHAAHFLYPDNQLQERILNIIPLLFKYDFKLIDHLYQALDLSHVDHQVISI